MAQRPASRKPSDLPIAARRGPIPKKPNLPPAYLEEVQYFQQLFSRYFSHLAKDVETAAFEMDWLYTRVVGNPFDTVRRSKAKSEVAKIAAALNLMGKHDIGYWQRLHGTIFEAKKSGSKFADEADEILKFILAVSDMESEGKLSKVAERFAKMAYEAIDKVPEQSNIRWEAVHAVEGLRILWWRNTGKDGPGRALNPASQFARYLRDGFRFLEIKASPEAAFKRWAAAYPKYDRSG